MAERRTGVALLAATLTVLTVAGCSGEPKQPPAPTEPSATSAAPTPAQFNPCDGLELSKVQNLYGTGFELNDGSDQVPLCVFTPKREGRAVIDINYSIFPGGLEAVLEQLGDPPATAEVFSVSVPDADAATLIVNEDENQVYLSGFVQTDTVIQTIDVVDPKPAATPRLKQTTQELMSRLARHARSQGITDETS